MFILCVACGTFRLPWEPGVYRARVSLVPIPVALVLPEASTELRTRILRFKKGLPIGESSTPASLYLLAKSFVNTTLAGDASLWDVRSARRRTDTHRVDGARCCLKCCAATACGCL